MTFIIQNPNFEINESFSTHILKANHKKLIFDYHH